MENDSKILLIISIGLIVIVSGCIGVQDSKISESIPNVLTSQNSGYQVKVTETKYLDNCYIETKNYKQAPCLFINLYFENNKDEKIDFDIISDAIVTKDGEQLKRYKSEFQLCDSCIRYTGTNFELFPNSHKNVGMCYPLVSETDNPKLYIELLINQNEKKEYSFDISPY